VNPVARSLARFLGFNALVAAIAIPLSGLACRLPTPADWIAILFLIIAAGGLKLFLRLLEP
jgi:hypothetical protein